jgi:5'-methylthioadenosine phosphorylase
MAHITDYDVWHETEEDVTVEMVVRTLHKNTALAQAAIAHLVQTMDRWTGEFAAHNALKDAIFTDRSRISAESRARVGIVADRYLPA